MNRMNEKEVAEVAVLAFMRYLIETITFSLKQKMASYIDLSQLFVSYGVF